jgi:Xaa-Pro aminopeptidase
MNVHTTREQRVPERLMRVREVMAREGVDALLVPSADPHLSEYLPGYWQGRRWLSGFDGSVGTLVVTANFAGVWADSRYWEQAIKELAGSGIELMKLQPGKPGALEWLGDNVPAKGTVAVDGAVMALASARQLEERLRGRDIRLVTSQDLLAEVWEERPALCISTCRLTPQSVGRKSLPSCAAPWKRRAQTGTSSRPWMTSPGCSICAVVMSPTTRYSFPLR